MNWKEKPQYHGFRIWVALSRNSRWKASVSALPEVKGVFPAEPGEQLVPGDLATEQEAELAARKYIDQKQQQRGK